MCFEDPIDFSLWILKPVSKCCGGQLKPLLYLIRITLGLVWDFAEAILLCTEILDVFDFDNTGVALTVTSLVVLLVFFITSILTLACLWGYAERDGLDSDVRRKRRNRFFIVFKSVNVVFAAILTAGAIYGREQLDIGNLFKGDNNGLKIFFVVSLGVDVAFDPIELIVGSCIMCRS